jgi:putative redox protein
MKSVVSWKARFTFEAKSRQHAWVLDTSAAMGGSDLGPTPKEQVLGAICGCAGMDVVGLLRKSRVELQSLVITAEAETGKEHPKVFTRVNLRFDAKGDPAVEPALIDAAKKSQSLYCGVSAMIAKACEIAYTVAFNDLVVYEALAAFPDSPRQ